MNFAGFRTVVFHFLFRKIINIILSNVANQHTEIRKFCQITKFNAKFMVCVKSVSVEQKAMSETSQ
jgi:hypothetical protein